MITHPQKNNLLLCLVFWTCVLFQCLTWPPSTYPVGLLCLWALPRRENQWRGLNTGAENLALTVSFPLSRQADRFWHLEEQRPVLLTGSNSRSPRAIEIETHCPERFNKSLSPTKMGTEPFAWCFSQAAYLGWQENCSTENACDGL